MNILNLFYRYKFLDKKFVGTSVKTVLTKVACDQFMMTPMLLALFFVGRSSSFLTFSNYLIHKFKIPTVFIHLDSTSEIAKQ